MADFKHKFAMGSKVSTISGDNGGDSVEEDEHLSTMNFDDTDEGFNNPIVKAVPSPGLYRADTIRKSFTVSSSALRTVSPAISDVRHTACAPAEIVAVTKESMRSVKSSRKVPRYGVNGIFSGRKASHVASSGGNNENSSIQIINIVSEEGFKAIPYSNDGVPKTESVRSTSNTNKPKGVIPQADLNKQESDNTCLSDCFSDKQHRTLGSTQPLIMTTGSSINPFDSKSMLSTQVLISPKSYKRLSQKESSKDFSATYRKLQEQLIHRQINYPPSESFQKRHSAASIRSKHSKKLSAANTDVREDTIHDKLYNDKGRYFERKRSQKNSKVEEELKQCTFTPNDRKSATRSFQQLYQDILSAQKRSEDHISMLREQQSQASCTFKIAEGQSVPLFKSGMGKCQTQTALKSYSSTVTDKLYEEAFLKVKAMHDASTRPDPHCTFQPQISRANKENELLSRRGSDALSETLYSEKMKKSKSRTREGSEVEAFKSYSVNDCKKTMSCLEMRIEKTLNDTLFQLEYDLSEGVDAENLFIILKFMDYATEKDEKFITEDVFKMCAVNQGLSWDDLKLLLCGIEGVFLKDVCKDRQIYLNNQRVIITCKDDFTRYHFALQRLFVTKNNARYFNRQKELDQMRSQIDAVEGISHRPRLNRKSVQIEESKHIGQRNTTLIEKGKEYMNSRKVKADQKAQKDRSECSFKPAISQKFCKKRNGSIHDTLYELGRKMSKERQKTDKSTIDKDFEQHQNECTFKPNLEKPDILHLTARQPFQDLTRSFAEKGQKKRASQDLKKPSKNEAQFQILQQQVEKLSDAFKVQKVKEDKMMHRNLLLSHNENGQVVEYKQPVLFLEVNIGGDRAAGKLLLFDGDSPEEVVNCFANVYQLSENKKKKLLDIVRVQLARILQQIGEAVLEEDDDEGSFSREKTEDDRSLLLY